MNTWHQLMRPKAAFSISAAASTFLHGGCYAVPLSLISTHYPLPLFPIIPLFPSIISILANEHFSVSPTLSLLFLVRVIFKLCERVLLWSRLWHTQLWMPGRSFSKFLNNTYSLHCLGRFYIFAVSIWFYVEQNHSFKEGHYHQMQQVCWKQNWKKF